MTHRINLDGNQGRGDPVVGQDPPPSTWIADLDYDEPETADLGLAPLSHVERAALRIGIVLFGFGMLALLISCIKP